MWGRKLRKYDQIIFIWWVPTIQGPVYLGMLQAMGKKRPPITLICHNVLPHEPKPGDRHLARTVLSRCDHIITHSPAQSAIASELSTTAVTIIPLPLTLMQAAKQAAKQGKLKQRLLFFGIVRPYKGLDVLLQALATVPEVKLTVVGEFWGGTKTYRQLISKLGLESRVSIRSGYVPANELAEDICKADAVILPYRTGTASWNVSLAHAYGTPVIATTAGSLGAQVHDGIDGLLCEPSDAASLAKAIRRFYEPGIALKLRAGIPALTAEEDWHTYIQTVVNI